MLTTLLLCIAAVLGIALLLYVARGAARPVRSTEEMFAAIKPVDVAAFRTLMDAGDEEYLRANLSSADFRQVQRSRLRAAAAYVSCTAHNAAVLIRLGEAAQSSSDPDIAGAGQKLAADAIQLRLRSLAALLWLYMHLLTPGVELGLSSLLENYMKMRDGMVRLVRLQTPTAVSRVQALL